MCTQNNSFSFYVVAGYTWVNAGATASTAVVLFSHYYLPPERQQLVKKNANCKHLCLLLDYCMSEMINKYKHIFKFSVKEPIVITIIPEKYKLSSLVLTEP